MSGTAKLNNETLREYLRLGMKPAEIARMFGVTRSAISQRMARLEATAAAAAPVVAARAVASLWDIRGALEANYAGCMALLDDVEQDPVRVRELVRRHIKDALSILETLYSVQEVQAFQEEVLAVLDEFEPGSRERVLGRLRERRSVRAALGGGGGTLAGGGAATS